MELIEIIRTSLIIFTAISTVFLAISYTIYKLRHRNGNRPYVKSNEFVPPVVLVKSSESSETTETEVRKQSPRFQVLNNNLKYELPVQNNLPVHKLRQKPVISYYSFNKNEPLQKFRTARVTIE